jgi:uncharacterized membrane protein (UPF0127 family)
MFVCRMLLMMSLAGFLGGCDEQKAQTIAEPTGPTEAQPRLPTISLYLGAENLTAEVARSRIALQTGMMFRKSLPETEGMLFVFAIPQQASFWMKNTEVPLSAAYIDPEGRILEMHDLQPGNTNTVVAASRNIQYVLEVNQGWFQKHRIEVGTLIMTERGSLRETFFQRRP